MCKISPSCLSSDKSSDVHVLLILLLLALWEVDLSVWSTEGVENVPEELICSGNHRFY